MSKLEPQFVSLTIHHLLPYLLIPILILTVGKSFLVGFMGKDLCLKKWKLTSISMILAHLQLVFGILVFSKFAFSNPVWVAIMKNAESREIFVEHPFMMLVAVILISVGKVKAKKIEDNTKSAKTTFTYFFIALALILLSTPFDKLF
ncbi:MAG: hypothetical protein QGG97_01560 [Flavobacteriales bacterium]|nr:hypothetical protein [Flavobacteriales bacterium]HJN63842.1 hypothetical protein [Flavobacteriales bacterium]